jgi:exonuclease VII small subunit
MIRPLLAVAAALFLAPVHALAADPAAPESVGVLAVGDPPNGPSPELVDLTRAFRGAVADRFKGVVSQEDLRLRMVGQTSASLTELDRAYAGAVAAYQSGDYESAVRTLRAVVDDLEQLPESDDAFRQWSRAMLRLARAEGSLGRKGEAREVMEALLRADPTVKPDPELYPPSFAKQLDEVRNALKAQPRRKLTVTAGGRQARVFVQGRDVGPAPASITVTPGKYRVSGVAGDARVSAGTVDVGETDQAVALDFGLAETYRPNGGPGLALPAAQRARGIVSAAAALKLDRVLIASISTDGDVRYLVGSLYDVRRGMLQREGLLRLAGFAPPKDGLAGLASFLATGERTPLVELPTESKKQAVDLGPTEPGRRGKKDGALLRWSPVATGVLAIGLGAWAGYEAVQAGSFYDDARAMLNPDGTIKSPYTPQQYNSAVSNGDSAKSTAWITGGSAAACAVATGVLGWLAYKQTGEVGPFRF